MRVMLAESIDRILGRERLVYTMTCANEIPGMKNLLMSVLHTFFCEFTLFRINDVDGAEVCVKMVNGMIVMFSDDDEGDETEICGIVRTRSSKRFRNFVVMLTVLIEQELHRKYDWEYGDEFYFRNMKIDCRNQNVCSTRRNAGCVDTSKKRLVLIWSSSPRDVDFAAGAMVYCIGGINTIDEYHMIIHVLTTKFGVLANSESCDGNSREVILTIGSHKVKAVFSTQEGFVLCFPHFKSNRVVSDDGFKWFAKVFTEYENIVNGEAAELKAQKQYKRPTETQGENNGPKE